METNKQLEIYSAAYAMAHYLEHGNFGKGCFMEMTEDEKNFVAVLKVAADRLGYKLADITARASLVVAREEYGTITVDQLSERLKPSRLPNGLPSRLCVVKEHPDYDEVCSRVGVRYNGVERKGDVHSYDVADGWIRVHIRDNKGRWKQSRGRFVTVKLNGIVEPYWK